MPILFFIASFFWFSPKTNLNENANKAQKYEAKAREAFKYCQAKSYNTQFCILIDLSKHSGLNRFFVYDFKQKKVLFAFPVSHGCGNHWWGFTSSKTKAEFSNKDGGHLSALGKYKIGSRGISNWGIKVNYLLHGLDKTNSLALPRQIVLHSWNLVPDNEVYPLGTSEGWGCPAISNANFKLLDPMLRKSKKPVLLWIYN